MKRITIFVLLLLFTLHANSQYDFRKTYWGMTKEQVKKTENNEVLEEQERLLLYFGTVADMDCFIIYFFAYDTLVRAKYIFKETHSRRNQYITDFENVNEILEKKYGEPDMEVQLWSNDLYKNDIDLKGLAVSLAHLDYIYKWNTERTEIMAILSGNEYVLLLHKYKYAHREAIIAILSAGDNYNIKHMVDYSSYKFKTLEERLNKEQQEDEF